MITRKRKRLFTQTSCTPKKRKTDTTISHRSNKTFTPTETAKRHRINSKIPNDTKEIAHAFRVIYHLIFHIPSFKEAIKKLPAKNVLHAQLDSYNFLDPHTNKLINLPKQLEVNKPNYKTGQGMETSNDDFIVRVLKKVLGHFRNNKNLFKIIKLSSDKNKPIYQNLKKHQTNASSSKISNQQMTVPNVLLLYFQRNNKQNQSFRDIMSLRVTFNRQKYQAYGFCLVDQIDEDNSTYSFLIKRRPLLWYQCDGNLHSHISRSKALDIARSASIYVYVKAPSWGGFCGKH